MGYYNRSQRSPPWPFLQFHCPTSKLEMFEFEPTNIAVISSKLCGGHNLTGVQQAALAVYSCATNNKHVSTLNPG